MSRIIWTVLFLSLLPSLALSHGRIERITCEGEESGLKLVGHESGSATNVLSFTLHSNGKKLHGPSPVRVRLRDEKKNGLIIERISIRIPKVGKAVLKVPEIEERRVRTGKGIFHTKTDSKSVNMKCQVTMHAEG